MHNAFFPLRQTQKHNVFTSYYHYDDQAYKDAFIRAFGHIFIDKSVSPGDISTDVSAEYVKRLIQGEKFLRDASVTIVLCGPNTKTRKHVDWEISGTLSSKIGGKAGLLGILLPHFPLNSNNTYNLTDLPPRLMDNVNTGYAAVYAWNDLTSDVEKVRNAIEQAFQNRTSDNSRNGRDQMQINTTGRL